MRPQQPGAATHGAGLDIRQQLAGVLFSLRGAQHGVGHKHFVKFGGDIVVQVPPGLGGLCLLQKFQRAAAVGDCLLQGRFVQLLVGHILQKAANSQAVGNFGHSVLVVVIGHIQIKVGMP